jgi:hypothetical protein
MQGSGFVGRSIPVSDRKPLVLVVLMLMLVLAAALASSCSSILGDQLNPKYCAAHPTDPDCLAQPPPPDAPDGPDTPTGCMSNAQCMLPMPVCLVEQRVCVQCTATDETACTGATPACAVDQMACVQCTAADQEACTGTTPLCGNNNSCRACASHTECPSAACLPSGACGDDTNVAYVDPMGTGTSCTKASPCVKVDDALKTGRPFVKFRGATDEQITLNNVNVTFLADPAAKLTSTNNGILLRIDGTSQVAIYDLEIGGASGASTPGVSLQPGTTATVNLVGVVLSGNTGAGINASSGTLSITRSTITGNSGPGVSASGTVDISQSTIGSNGGPGVTSTGGMLTISRSTIHENIGGGVSISDATFSVTNNFIYRNGSGSSTTFGGIGLGAFAAAMSKLEFNTIVDNQARITPTSAGGVICDQPGFSAGHNIIFRNEGGVAGNLQTLGVCTYADSYVVPGASNIDNAPGFASPNTPPFDYHLSTTSPASIVNAAGACSTVDFDGDQRPAGAECDLGADERIP